VNYLDAVIDISHFNGPTLDFAAAQRAGLMGVICKATQGTDYVDPTLDERRTAAHTAGLLTGAYHFGVGGDGVGQAGVFLSHAQPGDLLALDLEPNPEGENMALQDVVDFVTYLVDAVAVQPLIYGSSYLKQLVAAGCPAELTACPLWLAEYGPQAALPFGWAVWSLWQYSDGHANAPPSPWPGIGVCDRDRFNGDADGLRAFWAAHALPGG
jgi:lysozyme